MNVYVIYKFSDSDKVRKKVNEIKEAINNDKGTYSNKVSFFMFPNNVKKKFWHREARKKIKKCNLVAFFDYKVGIFDMLYFISVTNSKTLFSDRIKSSDITQFVIL